MKILIYTGYNETPRYKIMGDFSSIDKHFYAQKHGYSFLSERQYDKYPRNISWYKIWKILKMIDDYDYICWMDADTLIQNPSIKIEDLINQEEQKDHTYLRIKEESIKTDLKKNNNKWFICSDDEWANLGPCLAGFIIKSCSESKSFFWRIYQKYEFDKHPWWDQGAAHALWHENPEDLKGLKVLSRVFMNSFADYKQDSFLIHDKFSILDGRVIPKQ